MEKNQMPEWATVGATVYGRTQGGRGDATYHKGIISRVTAASVFVRFNTAAGEAAGEERYTLRGYNKVLTRYGLDDTYYSRILLSEDEGVRATAQAAAHREARRITTAAMRAAADAGNRMNPTTARQAIEALQAYLQQGEG